MLANALDRAMDWTVLPGYSRIGYAVRRRSWEQDAVQGLAGSSALVTGASSGIGAAASELLARAGARVHMLVRDRDRGERARAEIATRTGSEQLEVQLCDVAELTSVREFASSFAATHDELHLLVNNAGVMPAERARTTEGFELTFATNVLGPFLLTGLLLPLLRRGAPSAVVNVSSGGMYTQRLDAGDPQLEHRAYDPAEFYAHSKRCEVILTELWAERLRGSGVSFHSMHPGWADTPGVRSSLPRFRKLMRPLLRDAAQAADTIVWLAGASEPAQASGGFWQDRARRPTHRLPRTRETAAERRDLWEQCLRLSAWDGELATAGSAASEIAEETQV